MSGIGNFIWIVYFINFAIIITIVCFQKRNPIASMAWIMCFVALPVVGGLIFLVFGVGVSTLTNRKYREKLEVNEKYILERQKEYAEKHSEITSNTLVNYLLNCDSVYTDNNEVEIFTSGKDKYKRLFEDIENAKESIDLLYFIFNDDVTGNTLMDLLVKKSDEGVRVRLLYDGGGTMLTSKKLFKRLDNSKNGQAVEFFPVRLSSLYKINHRNHRKIVVIDGIIAYLGGMNIGDEYANISKKKRPPFRDTHIRIFGEAAEYAARCFAMDWEFSTGEQVRVKNLAEMFDMDEKLPMQIVASGPDSKNEEIKSGMIKMINGAKKYVYIQTPYFVPDQAFLTALEIAKKSGVDVRIMIPGIPDKKYVYHTTMSYIGEALDFGIKVYLYPGFIHAKTVTADDKILTIGSANTDIRSFELLFEINAFMYDEKTAKLSREIFEKDMASCTVLSCEQYKKRGVLKMMQEGFFRLFSPIM
ncbi:MAG: cardiolipin synthase [Firmicutes bacterium]|nr:cardiolipin synthase [Bacillota bacterium]